jgi:trimeric autotransporter adhesin
MKRLRTILIILSLTLFANSALAQTEKNAQSQQPSTPAVLASGSAVDVRFTAPEGVLQMRLEIYNDKGDLVFDSGLRKGSILDWKITDASQALTNGSYICAVTVMDLQGQLKQRLGAFSLQSGQLTLQRLGQGELNAAQSQALTIRKQAQKIETANNNEFITVLREGKDRSVVVTAHDGQDGQVAATSGAITFRTGDIFSNRAREQMRITPDGRVGIGIDKPEATLDVAGQIRARGGISFDDGTVMTTAPRVGGSPTLIGGTGTQNKISKWTDNVGNLGDSSITEDTNGNIGIGAAPAASVRLNVSSPFGTVPFGFTQNAPASSSPSLALFSTSDGVIGQYAALTNNGAITFVMGATAAHNFGIFANNSYNAPQLFIKNDGNIGIGTTNPTGGKLEVLGNVKISGAGNGIIFADGSKLTTANGGVSTPSGTSIVAAINDPATTGVISDNRISANLARLNGANAWTGANVFGAGLSANNALITNVGNPVNAGDAVNKAYSDANFVKFVPGAEQLSVGDANGTAPMINLRGGSTCCSGPGGHTPAWFKVFQNGSFVATGNLGIGVSPMQGKGYRTSWDSYKGAFRSGYADNEWDDANVGFFSWAGGSNSTAIGLYAFAFGDTNSAESTSSIVFGSGNQVKGAAGFSAGAGNRVCDTYGVAFGNKAQSGGPLINGRCDPDSFNLRGLAAVAIGYNVTADQDHTTAMGKFATNNGFSGTFIWSDGSATASADTFRNTANNEFAARATGGFRFRTNLAGTTGCNLPAGSGVFNCTSSRYTKENFLLINGEDVLTRLRNIPVSTWNYISEGNKVRHMGPMAEDFYQAFKLGTGNTSIGVQDLAGVSLAGIKALDERTNELQKKSAEVEVLRLQVDALRAANAAMEQRLAALEQNASKSTQSKAKGRRR